jgi:DNA-binding response OmpR family regulator
MRQRIAVIDDDKDLRDLLQIALKIEGFEVSTYPSGDEFLRTRSNTVAPDLYVIDLNLGGLSGAELCTILKSGDGIVAQPLVVLISANPEIQQIAKESQADGWVLKPVTQRELIFKIGSLLSNRAQG